MKKNSNIIENLKSCVASAYATAVIVKMQHWNVEGENFFVLHKFYDELYASLVDQGDESAERVRAMGQKVDDTVEKVVKILKDYSYKNISDIKGAKEIAGIYDGHRALISDTLQQALDLNDNVVADILTGQIELIEKNLWMLNSFAKA